MNDGLPPEKVFRVLELISQRPRVSQRELAEKTGFSLGLINLTLKRLIQTGHIKVSALNRRKLEYLLTRKGLVEKTNRTTHYISRTLETFSEYKRRIDGLLQELIAEGYTSFALLGKGEVSSMVELFVNQQGPPLRHRYIEDGADIQEGEVVLDCRLHKASGAVGVSILERLLQVNTQRELEVVEK
jgi:DNA-binding MarR family transcriptional regulator